jgi:hypothetical protein
MRRRNVPLTLVAATCALAALAAAPGALADTSRDMMLELHFGPYTPEVDSAFSVGAGQSGPYEAAFSGDGMFMLGMYLDYQLWQDVGSVAIGGGWQYGWVDGTAIEEGATDETGFNLVPFDVAVTYRFDYLARRWGVPLVPYVKAGFTWALWWVTNGKDEIANARSPDPPYEGRTGMSNTFGFFAGGGLQLLLDVLDRSMAMSLDEETGINHSYLFVEFTRRELNDFYSASSIDLSESHLSFGLMFEF